MKTLTRIKESLRTLHGAVARNGVAVRSFSFVVIMTLVVAGLGTLTGYVTFHSAADFGVLAQEHEPARDAMEKMTENLTALNNRLLGVMADVYSSSGSVDRVNRMAAGVTEAWTAFEAVGGESLAGAAMAPARDAVAKLPAFNTRLTDALRTNKKLSNL